MLKRICEAVPPDLVADLIHDLIETMRAHPRCVGLAAPQIGEPLQVAVVDVSAHPTVTASNGLLLLVNPRILEVSVGMEVGREGCQSLPGITADIRRARRLRLEGGDRELWASGFEARAVQHEIDHLGGILILDRVESVHGLHPRLQSPT